jgi:hypothetical protein
MMRPTSKVRNKVEETHDLQRRKAENSCVRNEGVCSSDKQGRGTNSQE